MARKKFELKSGNRVSFKEMGSSPLLQEEEKTSSFDAFAAMGRAIGGEGSGEDKPSNIVDPSKYYKEYKGKGKKPKKMPEEEMESLPTEEMEVDLGSGPDLKKREMPKKK
tara:strand:+ start:241 stop:570 length:330 start_codon:yes stop_codon:yes gene_type:complete